MKNLLILFLVLAGSLATTSSYSQVRVNAHVGIGTPAPVIYERDYPGYTYYTYPAWRGHYRDQYYYRHYRPAFEREHRGYFHGRRFDHARYEHDRGNRGRGNNRSEGNRRHH